jgi:hypothetical protein
MMCLRS